ncbi:MAG TPA: ABC-F family ATP-binding cassette domain-containing protein [Micromonosporaceae bacterium]
MFKVIDVAATFGDETLFAGATFEIAAGERIGLVGPNGAGKSTLLQIMAGERRPLRGHVEVPPGLRVGHFTQQVPDPRWTVREFLDEAPGELAALERRMAELSVRAEDHLDEFGALHERYAQLGGWAYAARTAELRDRLGVAGIDDATRLGELSGGEQARLMLARVLLDEPGLLLLDEPTNHLDAAGIEWLGRYLSGFGGPIVLVTHDRALLDRVATRIIEIDGIRDEPQQYVGGYTDYRAEKQRRWLRLLADFEAQEKARSRLAGDIERTKNQSLSVELTTRNDVLRRYAKKVAAKAKARERRLTRQMEAASWIAEPATRPPLTLAFPQRDADAADRVLLAVSGLRLEQAGRTLIKDLDLVVRSTDRLVLTGANGTGKTTLLRALAGIDEPAGGTVRRDGVLALLPQTHDELRLRTSVLEFFRSRVPVYIDEAEALLRAYLFDDEQQRQPLRTLSAGELRRLLLATIVNSDAEMILLDEPTNFLDFDALDLLEEALRAYGGAVLVVTHDAYLPGAIGCDRRLEVAGPNIQELARGATEKLSRTCQT